MTPFNIRNLLDVRCICSVLADAPGELVFDGHGSLDFAIDAPTDEPLLFKINETLYRSIRVADVQTVIEGDARNRLDELPGDLRFTVVVPRDLDYWEMDTSQLPPLVAAGVKFAIHTPSKALAKVAGAYYSSELDTAIQKDVSKRLTIIPTSNPVWVGTDPVPGVAHLATNLDERLVYQRDEDYLALLHQCERVCVLDDLSQFLLQGEGIEAEIIA